MKKMIIYEEEEVNDLSAGQIIVSTYKIVIDCSLILFLFCFIGKEMLYHTIICAILIVGRIIYEVAKWIKILKKEK